MLTPRQLKERYLSGENISQILREMKAQQLNDEEIIETSYDIQTGLYMDMMKVKEKAEKREELTKEIADTINYYMIPQSILEPGVGEATTLSGVLKKVNKNINAYAFDISWSRVAYSRLWLADAGVPLPERIKLFTASMLNIPLPTSSIDVVYTAHAIEPNAGYEAAIIQELHRVARHYLILVEPAYELASAEARKRMVEHKYCKGLAGKANHLGYNVIKHELCQSIENEMNPPAMTIIEKGDTAYDYPRYVCPKYKTDLKALGGMLYSPESLAVYPVLNGIPCLRIENAIVASKYEEIVGGADGLSKV